MVPDAHSRDEKAAPGHLGGSVAECNSQIWSEDTSEFFFFSKMSLKLKVKLILSIYVYIHIWGILYNLELRGWDERSHEPKQHVGERYVGRPQPSCSAAAVRGPGLGTTLTVFLTGRMTSTPGAGVPSARLSQVHPWAHLLNTGVLSHQGPNSAPHHFHFPEEKGGHYPD